MGAEPQTDDDRELLDAWHGGEKSAGQQLVRRYHEPIARFFRTKAYDQSEDLTQRTFLAMAEARGRWAGQSTFRAYLFGIARNVLFGFYRSKNKHGGVAPDFSAESLVDLSPGVSTQAAVRAEMRVLVQALQRIPADSQSLLELHCWEGLTVDELASVFEVAPGTIKSRMHRARKALAREMERVPAAPALLQSTTELYAEWLRGAPQ